MLGERACRWSRKGRPSHAIDRGGVVPPGIGDADAPGSKP